MYLTLKIAYLGNDKDLSIAMNFPVLYLSLQHLGRSALVDKIAIVRDEIQGQILS